MTDIYWFSTCPNCKAEVTDRIGTPELSGYEGDYVTCSKCKKRFVILMSLVHFELTEKAKKKLKVEE